jgi:hypothetical protein
VLLRFEHPTAARPTSCIVCGGRDVRRAKGMSLEVGSCAVEENSGTKTKTTVENQSVLRLMSLLPCRYGAAERDTADGPRSAAFGKFDCDHPNAQSLEKLAHAGRRLNPPFPMPRCAPCCTPCAIGLPSRRAPILRLSSLNCVKSSMQGTGSRLRLRSRRRPLQETRPASSS